MKTALGHLTKNLLFLSAALAVTVLLFITAPMDGDFWWYDSSRHAMNGVFIRDFFLDGGLNHPKEYALEYYKKYPAINIGFYPPFFYVTSAPFLALFRVNHNISQLVVVIYCLAAGVATYAICKPHTDQLAATATALFVMTMPGMALWTRQVQLDVPALALLLVATYFLIRHLETGLSTTLFAAVVALGCAVLTRVQIVFAFPAIIFFLFLYNYQNRPPLKIRIAAIAVLFLLSVPTFILVAYFSKINTSLATATPGMPSLFSVENLVWYAKTLPSQMSWPGFAFSILGICAGGFLIFRRAISKSMLVIAMLGLSSWIFFTVVSNKDPRFNLPSLAFIAIFAALGLYKLDRRLARLALVALAIYTIISAVILQNVPYVAGFKEAASIATEIADANTNILISAHRDGTFIYNVRALGTRQDIEIRRADKIFVEMRIMRSLGIKDNNFNEDSILRVLEQENISVVVAQPDYLSDQPSMQRLRNAFLRKVLSTDRRNNPISRAAKYQ